jgi:CheY-like chemotaxis protein
VIAAASAADAPSLFSADVPHIVVSDIGLPGVDGYDLMEQICRRSVADGEGVPAIALTAYARSEDRTRAPLAGYQAHLAKPVEPSELVATVASFVELIAAQAEKSTE